MPDNATYTFGIANGVEGHDDWLVQNASKSTSAQEALALDKDGEPVYVHYYQKVQEMSFEVIIPEGTSESDMPAVGEIFQYGKDKSNNPIYWYVSASTLSETNTDFQRYSLTCKRFTESKLPNAPAQSNP